ncbi:hypothetical protein [Streptomyces sp. bgisy095]|uniref:hypothetical protein n=1 Tax=unclassified Streptomyces TaxID=2593676 RepID=UPI003D73D58D
MGTERNTDGAVGRFAVIAVDRHGRLREDDEVLAGVVRELADERRPVTDVVVLSHGWQTDAAAATATYEAWVRTMADHLEVRADESDRRRPGLRLLVVGVHWPSAPWEDPDSLGSLTRRVAAHTELIGDPAAARQLEPLLAEDDPEDLDPADEARLRTLDELSGLSKGLVGAAPGDDRGDFSPRRIFADFRRSAWYGTVGAAPIRPLLAPLWVTSFWKMKRRAWHVGRTGVHRLLTVLRAAEPSGRVRFHLVGHSFGAIVCAGAVQGERPDSAVPVDSLTLLQGALSLWAFAPSIPDTGRHGFFHPLVARDLVRGPVVATQSRHDRALAWFFRMAATASADNRLRPRTPRYGAVGTYGLAGLERTERDVVRKGRLQYAFEPGTRYNLDCSQVIAHPGFSVQGAHSNLIHAELAAVVWEAILPAGG